MLFRSYQILVVFGISASQEEFILTAFRILSISPQPEKDLEVSLDSSYLYTKEIDESCTRFEGEHLVQPEIKQLSPCPVASLVCIRETNYPSFLGTAKEDFQSGPKEEMSQYHQDYIEHWFQITIQLKNHSHIQITFVSHLSKVFIVHAHIPFKFYMLNLGMVMSLYLIHTWLHYNLSFT